MDLNQKIADFQTEIIKSKYTTFLTGAGVSTHSNIPDYRSKEGIYNGISQSPEILLSVDTLYHHPKEFHDFIIKNMYFPNALPNAIHKKIAQICKKHGQLITQNVDGLDLKAKNNHIIEFHGNLYDIYCTKCYKKITYQAYQKSYLHNTDHGIIRPGIVLYGELINQEKLISSINTIQKSDLIIIVGTSFVVYPFAELLSYRKPNCKIWIINDKKITNNENFNFIINDALPVFRQLTI